MKPIYVPSGKAKEYGDYALNIYTGCPHECFYCFAPSVLRRDREQFHTVVEPRKDIVEETRKQIEREKITGKLIHLCFTCDPYPCGYDTTPTRDIIALLKGSGNNVQILTKSAEMRDFDLLTSDDWYGVTIDGCNESGHNEKSATPLSRYMALNEAHRRGIKTWVSFEPVINAENVRKTIKSIAHFIDKVKIGKLNYHPSDINWADFGRKAESLCQQLGIEYYIKDSLRKEMEGVNNEHL